MKTPPPRLLGETISLLGSQGLAKHDFKILASLKQDFGYGYQDHNRALQFLIETGLVEEQDGLLTLGFVPKADWLLKELESASSEFWEFADLLPTKMWKFNPDKEISRELGAAGELYVMEQLRTSIDPDRHQRIRHVSLLDDSLGYDILSPSTGEGQGEVHLEVKTTSRPGSHVSFYLTRNEAATGAQTKNWFLVFVKVERGIPRLLGNLPFRDIEKQLPTDSNPDFRWSEAQVKLEPQYLRPGLP